MTPEIDWGSAEVRDGELVVKLTDTPPKEWRDRAAGVADLLRERGRGHFGEVEVKKDSIRVAGVEEGAEADVRHFLEGIVLEANGTLDDEDDADGEDEREADSPDARMTEAFRAFDT